MMRRDFLRRVGLGGMAVAAGAFTTAWPSTARAFGIAPRAAQSSMLPADLCAKSILEIYLFGGVSQFESFYVLPSGTGGTGLHWLSDVSAAADACGIGSAALVEPFAEDAN